MTNQLQLFGRRLEDSIGFQLEQTMKVLKLTSDLKEFLGEMARKEKQALDLGQVAMQMGRYKGALEATLLRLQQIPSTRIRHEAQEENERRAN